MNVFTHYKAEIRFAVILVAVVAFSLWASRFIPDDYFDGAITPILMSASTAVALCCAWITARHTEGYRLRRIWAWTLLLWGLLDGIYVVSWLFMGKPVMNMGAYELTTMEIALGNLLGWSLLLFPTEALRPGWLNVRRALLQILPMNRTYLSQFIHAEYDCSFYLFVNRYRIEEAKRLMADNPDMKMAEISASCGFSSPSVFSRTFTAIAGQSPSEWGKI
ncbi:MAG: AraC family transcriptional regulator [Bacteroidales bacterium]|nr:AraC family transcriptional regulator [Bacteroidales bacterium]